MNNQTLVHGGVWRDGCTATRIFDLCMRWGWWVPLHPDPCTFRKRAPVTNYWALDGTQSRRTFHEAFNKLKFSCAEYGSLLGCYAVTSGKAWPKFRRHYGSPKRRWPSTIRHKMTSKKARRFSATAVVISSLESLIVHEIERRLNTEWCDETARWAEKVWWENYYACFMEMPRFVKVTTGKAWKFPVRTEGVTAYILNKYIEGSLLYRVSVNLGLSF
jgi:hypothetical protein